MGTWVNHMNTEITPCFLLISHIIQTTWTFIYSIYMYLVSSNVEKMSANARISRIFLLIIPITILQNELKQCIHVCLTFKVRRERFVEELESYQKQVEEFATYGDMNDIQKYLRKSQNLETKLTAAAEKVGAIIIPQANTV